MQGVCHRDLRLESLRLNAEGNLKIGDFAYAGSRPTGGDCQDSAHDSLHRAAHGSAAAAQVAFMPPEVVVGHHTGCNGEVLGEQDPVRLSGGVMPSAVARLQLDSCFKPLESSSNLKFPKTFIRV